MNLSMLDREQLEGMLLARPPIPPPGSGPSLAPESVDRATALRSRLAIARELLLRDASRELAETSTLESPDTVRRYLAVHFATLATEAFLVIYLTAQNRVIECEEAFKGTLTQCSVYPREIVRGALMRNAAAVLLAHNHPSGYSEPSRADEYLTQTIKSALVLVDVRVLDHVVFGGGTFVSFAERGLL